VALLVTVTWRQGRNLMARRVRDQGAQLVPCLDSLRQHPPVRVPGTAVFLTMEPALIPQAMLHNLKHNKVLHERNVFLTVEFVDEPRVDAAERVRIEALGGDFFRMHAYFGFAEDPDVPGVLEACGAQGLGFSLMETTFFTSRENIVAGDLAGMMGWRDKLFAYLARNALPATAYFRIPDNRLIEIGRRIAL
jgi:KUP system potassium uptake protein